MAPYVYDINKMYLDILILLFVLKYDRNRGVVVRSSGGGGWRHKGEEKDCHIRSKSIDDKYMNKLQSYVYLILDDWVWEHFYFMINLCPKPTYKNQNVVE